MSGHRRRFSPVAQLFSPSVFCDGGEACVADPVKCADSDPFFFRFPSRNRHEVSLAHNPKVTEALLDNIKLVRYQINPQANWGPARAAIRGAPPPK